jgi:hypothetical protein
MSSALAACASIADVDGAPTRLMHAAAVRATMARLIDANETSSSALVDVLVKAATSGNIADADAALMLLPDVAMRPKLYLAYAAFAQTGDALRMARILRHVAPPIASADVAMLESVLAAAAPEPPAAAIASTSADIVHKAPAPAAPPRRRHTTALAIASAPDEYSITTVTQALAALGTMTTAVPPKDALASTELIAHIMALTHGISASRIRTVLSYTYSAFQCINGSRVNAYRFQLKTTPLSASSSSSSIAPPATAASESDDDDDDEYQSDSFCENDMPKKRRRLAKKSARFLFDTEAVDDDDK